MDDEILKLECLKRAEAQGLKGDEARKEAQRIFDWTKGRGQGDGLVATEVPKARVVGRDGDLEQPFKDYVKE